MTRQPRQIVLRGDAGKARAALGWKPKLSFAELVESMVRSDIELLSSDLTRTS